MRLYVKENTGFILLDLMENNPIKLNMSVADIMDPTANPSTYSQTFRVPNTANNNLFFKSAFNINAISFDATKKIESYVEDSNVTISVGSIRLTNIVTNNRDKNVEYEITFFGEVSDFSSAVGGGFLNSLNLTAYNHVKNYVNVVNSWSKTLLNGDVIYPLIEWGYDYFEGEPVQNTLSNHDNQISKKGFTANNHPLSIEQFKPVIRAKVLIDAIFASSGFTYESTFLNGTDFLNQYIITEQIDTAIDRRTPKFQAKGSAGQQLNQTLSKLFFPNEIYDTANSFDNSPSKYIFTVPITFQNPLVDYYTFNINGSYRQIATTPTVTFTIQVFNLSLPIPAVIASQTYTYAPIIQNEIFNFNHTFNIYNAQAAIGDQLIFRINAPSLAFVGGASVLNLTLTQSTTIDNINVLNNYLPNNVKNIDFLKAIIERYNLVLEPSKNKSKHFIITPWVDWVEQGTQRDWTNLVDGNLDIQSKPLFESQTRSNTFLDDEDSDYVNYNFQTATKTTYGQLEIDSQNENIVGNKVTQSLFSPTPLLPIGNSSAQTSASANQKLAAKFLIPHIAKDTTTERTPIVPKLRLVYYNGMVNAPLEWHIKNDANTTIHWNQYPLVSQYSLFTYTSNFIDMAWRNSAPLYPITPTVVNPPFRTILDLFNNYWQKWYNFTYDSFGRILEMNIVLDYKNIFDLRFNDKIFIKDSWFMVNKITDYEVGKPTSCKVELIRVGEQISIVPSQLITGQLMCYGASGETPCNVYCCFQNGGANTIYFEINGELFIDANGNFPAPNGIYSYGSLNTFSVLNGNITSYYNTAGCVCIPSVLQFYQPCRGNSVYQAGCCQFPLQPFYAYSNTVYQATQAWSNIAMTTPVTDGWYANPGESFVAQFINGINVQVAARITCIP
jgi:hypothetical protein